MIEAENDPAVTRALERRVRGFTRMLRVCGLVIRREFHLMSAITSNITHVVEYHLKRHDECVAEIKKLRATPNVELREIK